MQQGNKWEINPLSQQIEYKLCSRQYSMCRGTVSTLELCHPVHPHGHSAIFEINRITWSRSTYPALFRVHGCIWGVSARFAGSSKYASLHRIAHYLLGSRKSRATWLRQRGGSRAQSHRGGQTCILPLTPFADQYSTAMLQCENIAPPMLLVDPVGGG